MGSYEVQYASDLHLDNESPPFDMILKPVAPNIALCGDIGDPFSTIYYDFLKWCKSKWATVYLLAGNHEYFSDDFKNMAEIEDKIRTISNDLDIVFLQKNTVAVESHNLIIVGCTLWSSPNVRYWDKIADGFIGNPGTRGDYRLIYKNDEYTNLVRPLHPSDIIKINREHIAYLEKVCKEATIRGYKILVLTHHLPSRLLNYKYKDHPLLMCYVNELDYLIQKPIVGWICGHSHSAYSLRFGNNGTLVTLNPMGYKSEAIVSGYTRSAVMTINENIAYVKRV
jgi:hypothetical protein